jgi:Uncharacterised protein conserved in bacteria (DUF2336)
MAAGRSAALITELEDALARCPRHRRALVIQEVIKLLLAQSRDNTRQLSSFDEVLACLIRQSEVADIANLSNTVATSRLMLPKAVRQLAFHENASVADPILKHAECIADDDLNELAETRGQQQLSAISSRTKLSESTTTKLVIRGNAAVHVTLARNLGARLTDRSFAVLLKLAERNEELAQALGSRPDLPATLVRKFLALVTGKPRIGFLNAAPPKMRILTEPEQVPDIPMQRDYAAAEKEMLALSRSGHLTDSAVNRFAMVQDYERLTAALALLAEASVTVIERLLCRDRLDEMVMACKAARLRWATTVSIIRCILRGATTSEQQLKELKRLFESLSLSEAQWTVRFGKADGIAKGDPTTNKPAEKRKHR